ncbi:N-acetylmuramoyl-L-alanine amidase [Ihubacter sp. rT4E-8]|uniref:N-acetylmuramoyl-L-alanine amidase n=1 Tax=Ihubacter sp. rT4E-8 TaxID=3242369 RepID=UPI003CF168C0
MVKKPIIFYLSHGHGSGSDKGAASGRFVELELARKVTKACYDYLLKQPKSKRSWRVTYKERLVSGYTLAQQAEQIKSLQNEYRTVSIDIHFNAGGGDGAEVWTTNRLGERKRLGTELGDSILSNLKKSGQNSRGMKYSNDLYFINTPSKGVSVLVECGFVDNKADRKGFDTDKELKAYGEAIAKALIQYAEKHE